MSSQPVAVQDHPTIRDISDTARWAAVYRARETERPDALFRDPLARRLAGERGEQIAADIPFSNKHTWSWVTRTFLFDQFITEQIRDGVDVVINLAAGLDARPYRMELPATLRWVEVDLPGLIKWKERELSAERPRCALERIGLDLSDVAARRELFDRVGRNAHKALVITEGLIIYLSADEVGAMATGLSAAPNVQRWVTDLCSPGLLRLLQKNIGGPLNRAGAPLKFGPEEGPSFFAPFGWRAVDVRGMLKTAARLRRLPWGLRIAALFPESKGRQGNRPWSGICLLAKS